MRNRLAKGFTLIQISILLTVASLVLIALLPSTRTQTENNAKTAERLNKVLVALRQFETSKGRLPCPADASQPIDGSLFGVEAANPGSATNCAGSSPAANYTDSANHVAIGAIPVRALGLTNGDALDYYGRLITYAVDTTATASCAWSGSSLTGHLSIADNGTTAKSLVALVSHGGDGHGAWIPVSAAAGSGVQLNAGSIDTDQLTNAHLDSGFSPILTLTNFVRKQPTATFDDVVVYQNPLVNLSAQPALAPSCSYARLITVNHTQVNGTQSNFPVLVSFTDNTMKNTAWGGHVANASGYDIRFSSDPAGTSPLNWETESYDATNGVLTAWVKVPSISSSIDTVFYMNYGNALINTAQNTPTAVWDSNYTGVWHFPNGTTLSPNDSSASGNNGTINFATAIGGVVGGGMDVTANYPTVAYMSYPTFSFSGDFTAEFWVNLLAISSDPNGNHAGIWAAPGCSVNAYNRQWRLWTGSHDDVISNTQVPLGQWHHIVITRASGNATLYQDGTANGTGTSSYTFQFSNIGVNGSDPYSEYKFDEFRFSNTARPAGWIASEYNNQKSSSTFLTIGSELPGGR